MKTRDSKQAEIQEIENYFLKQASSASPLTDQLLPEYAWSRPETQDMAIGLLSRCLGGSSAIVTYSKHPQNFKNIKALILLQSLSIRPFVEQGAKSAGFDPKETADAFDTAIYHLTGFHLDELTPTPYAKDVKEVPTLIAQVHRDVMTVPSDIETMYEKLGTREKELLWIEGTTVRFDGYTYFARNPEKMLGWFNKYK